MHSWEEKLNFAAFLLTGAALLTALAFTGTVLFSKGHSLTLITLYFGIIALVPWINLVHEEHEGLLGVIVGALITFLATLVICAYTATPVAGWVLTTAEAISCLLALLWSAGFVMEFEGQRRNPKLLRFIWS